MWTWETLYRPERTLCRPERALLRSTVEVGPLSAQEGNLSLWEGLCCSERAHYRSSGALNWFELTQDAIPSVWEGLMLH